MKTGEVLLKQAVLHAPVHPRDGQAVDVLLKDGRIAKIEAANSLTTDGQTLAGPDLHVAPGWVDLAAELNVPGREDRATLPVLAEAARRGGFVSVIVHPTPELEPPLATPDALRAARQAAAELPVYLGFAANLTLGGTHMAPLVELAQAGALGFSDGPADIADAGLLVRLLQYSRLTERPVFLSPLDAALAESGRVAESPTATQLGLAAVPGIAEAVAVQRALDVLTYTGGRLHLGPLTTAAGVARVRAAKQQGLPVSAHTGVAHICFTTEALVSFDANLCVWPPLPSPADQAALIAGLHDGTLDAIASHHAPRTPEEKTVPFTEALPGTLSLEVAFAALHTALVVPGHLTLPHLLHLLHRGPQVVLGLPETPLAVGEPASVSLFRLEEKWTPTTNDLAGRAANCAWLGNELIGQPVPLP